MFRLIYILVVAFSFEHVAYASDGNIFLERLTSLNRHQEVIEELQTTEYSPALSKEERNDIYDILTVIRIEADKIQINKLNPEEKEHYISTFPLF